MSFARREEEEHDVSQKVFDDCCSEKSFVMHVVLTINVHRLHGVSFIKVVVIQFNHTFCNEHDVTLCYDTRNATIHDSLNDWESNLAPFIIAYM